MGIGNRDDARALADEFAQAVQRRETEQLHQLVGHVPAMDVRFSLGQEPGRSASEAVSLAVGDITDYYRHSTEGRLMVIGAGGTGKTVLLMRLVLGLLDARRPGEAVPCRVSASGWDVRQDFDRWMTGEIAKDSGLSSSQAGTLVSEGLIVPMLDGLDEMDPPAAGYPRRAAAALRTLHERMRDGRPTPFVATCRDGFHQRLIGPEEQPSDTALVTMRALEVEQIHRFIRAFGEPAHWRPVLDELERRPGGRLAEELSVPWRLAVVTTLYGEHGPDRRHQRDPSDLVGTQEPRPGGGLVPLYASALLRTSGSDARETRRIQGMLTELATYLVDNQTLQRRAGGEPLPHVDVIVHKLWPITGNRPARWLGAALSMVLWIPAALVTCWVLARMHWPAELDAGIAIAASLLPLHSLRSSLTWWPHPKRIVLGRLRTRAGQARLAMTFAAAAVLGMILAATGRPDYALACAISFGVVFGSGIGLAVRDTADSRLLVLTGAGTALLLCMVGRVLVGFLGAVGGLLFGTAAGGLALFAAVAAALRSPRATPGHMRNPVFDEFIRNDLRTGLVSGTLTFAITMALLALLPGLHASLAQIALAAGGVGLSVGLGAVADTWRRHVAMILSARGRLPLRLGAALEHSYRAGLLRRAGIAYQFRHLELRDHFAHNATR
ncbi:hypothetical protein [Streptomyces sp. NPDC057623]|uniref:hypothetical protein n=1 Tax=Streptomyces sp. NPDC057623 TaxID=3346187 RepID=UPI0036A26823